MLYFFVIFIPPIILKCIALLLLNLSNQLRSDGLKPAFQHIVSRYRKYRHHKYFILKSLILIFIITLSSFAMLGQSVSINEDASAPHLSAMLDIKSTTKGLLIPRMTTVERTAILTPALGLMVFDITTNSYWFHNGTIFQPLSTGGNGWNLTGNATTNPSTNFIGTTDNQSLRFKVNNTWSGEINPITANTFYGLLAGNGSISGVGNTAVGQNTFSQNTTGGYNTAMGLNTLSNNLTGEYNTAIGERVLQFNNSTYNTGIGAEALRQNTAGSNNTAAGVFALYNNSVGFFNSAFGYQALISNIAGTTLTALGYNADVTFDFASNATAIGAGAKVDASNKVRIGNTTVSSIGGQVGWSTFSDGRYKNSIREDVKGLDFILNLRPVTYTIDIPGLDNYFSNKKFSYAKTMENTAPKRESGFIAQEVETAAKISAFPFSGVDRPEKPEGLYALRYAEFVVPLVKAMQEQQSIISNLQKQIDEMKNIMVELKIEITTLKNKN